jgi:dsDNA-binding SOS-regulon protein
LLIFLMLAGCSASMSYRFADWVIGWRMAKYVDWQGEQEPQFERAVDNLLSWHRGTQIAAYQRWLIDVKGSLLPTASPQQWPGLLAEIEVFWGDIMRSITADGVLLLASLNDEQAQVMLEALRDDIARERRQLTDLNDQERFNERLDKAEQTIARWVGSLSDEQQHSVALWLAGQTDTYAMWLDHRQRWVNRFEQVLSVRSSPEFADQLANLLVDSGELRTPQYQQALAQNTEQSLIFFAGFYEGLSERQRRHLSKALDHWIKRLDSMRGSPQWVMNQSPSN